MNIISFEDVKLPIENKCYFNKFPDLKIIKFVTDEGLKYSIYYKSLIGWRDLWTSNLNILDIFGKKIVLTNKKYFDTLLEVVNLINYNIKLFNNLYKYSGINNNKLLGV